MECACEYMYVCVFVCVFVSLTLNVVKMLFNLASFQNKTVLMDFCIYIWYKLYCPLCIVVIEHEMDLYFGLFTTVATY